MAEDFGKNNDRSLAILQWNCRGFVNSRVELINAIEKEEIDPDVKELLELLIGINEDQRNAACEIWKLVLPLFLAALSHDGENHTYQTRQKAQCDDVPCATSVNDAALSTDVKHITVNQNHYVPQLQNTEVPSQCKVPQEQASVIEIDQTASVIPIQLGDDHSYNIINTTETESDYATVTQDTVLTDDCLHIQVEVEDGQTSMIQVGGDVSNINNKVTGGEPDKVEVLIQHDDGRWEVCTLRKPPPSDGNQDDPVKLGSDDFGDNVDNDDNDDNDDNNDNVGDSQEPRKRKRWIKREKEQDVYDSDGKILKRSKGRPKKMIDFESVTQRNGKKMYLCPVCKGKVSTPYSLEVHMRIHSGLKPFSCSMCSKMFRTKGNMVQHERSHFEDKLFQCSECQKFFKEEKTLRIHMRIHTGARPYICSVCSKAFTQCGSLGTHMRIHTGVKKYLCDLCGKNFTCSGQLSVHKRRHLDQRDFKCEQCEFAFVCKSELDRHLLHHTGEKPFLCGICPKSFSRKTYLQEHMNFHIGHKPYQCKSCSSSFHHYSKFNRHRQKHRAEEEKAKRSGEAAKKISSSVSHQPPIGETENSTGIEVVIDENAKPEELERLQSIVLSAVNSGEISMPMHFLPVYKFTMTDQGKSHSLNSIETMVENE